MICAEGSVWTRANNDGAEETLLEDAEPPKENPVAPEPKTLLPVPPCARPQNKAGWEEGCA